MMLALTSERAPAIHKSQKRKKQPFKRYRKQNSWFARLFIVPHFLVGIGLIGVLILTLAWAAFGHDVQGVIDDARQTTNSKGKPIYQIEFHYADRGHEKSDTLS